MCSWVFLHCPKRDRSARRWWKHEAKAKEKERDKGRGVS
jgi:hypothetical protein